MKYFSVAERKYLVDKVVDACIEEKDGLLIPDMILKEYFFHLYLMQMYDEVELPEDGQMEFYDEYCTSGKMKELIGKLDTTYCVLEEAIDAQLHATLKVKNSIEGIVAKKLSEFITMMDKRLDSKNLNKLIKSMEKLNPQMAQQVLEVVKSK